MLLASEQKVKLKKTYEKILYLSAAAKGTYVFLGMPSIGRDVLVHCDKQGKILYENVFANGTNIDSFGMLSENEVIILSARQNKISILDLQTHQLTHFNHQFMFEQGDQSWIQTFADTRILCVVQCGRYNDHRFKLSYYSYPLKEDQPPIAVYESKEDEWTYEYPVRKGNNHSLMIWYKQRGDQFLDIRTFTLRDHSNGSFQIYKIRNTIGQAYKLNKAQLAISNIWQSHKGQLLAVCASNKTQLKAESYPGIIINNFIIDLDKSTIREAKFFFDPEYNDYLIDYLNVGSYSMFRTYSFDNGNTLQTPVYYVSHETESIIAKQTWKCTYLTKFFIPGYDSSMIMQNEYQNGDVKEFTVKLKKVMDPKQIALHFMLHINDEFDDDLLQDALELLEQI